MLCSNKLTKQNKTKEKPPYCDNYISDHYKSTNLSNRINIFLKWSIRLFNRVIFTVWRSGHKIKEVNLLETKHEKKEAVTVLAFVLWFSV